MSQFLPTHTERILQFGEGNFLRAFVDWKIQKLNQTTDFKGSIVVVQPIEQGMVDMLNEQNCNFTLLLRGLENGKPKTYTELITSISRGINPYVNLESYLQTANQPEIRFIVSNTTEAGICFDPNEPKPEELAVTFPAKITQWLFQRYTTFKGDNSKGIIFLPCELIEANGTKLKDAVMKYIDSWAMDAEFKNWVDTTSVFCNTLVDRIVPGFPRETIKDIYAHLGYEDKLVVEGEIFHLWVIEGPQWIKDELPLHETGLNVKFVDDLSNYRTRKVRILNGAHTILVPVAFLYGLDMVRESVEHPMLGKFLDICINNEIIPTLDLPYDELKEFADTVSSRFRNPYIKHFLSSIALNSISKFETRVLPTLIQYHQQNKSYPKYILFSFAALLTFYKGNACGRQTPVNDSPEIMEFFKINWAKYENQECTLSDFVQKVLEQESFWKQDLSKMIGLSIALRKSLAIIEEKGVKLALQDLL